MNERDEELRDKDVYIRKLEDTLQEKHLLPSHKSSAQSLFLPQMIPLPPSPTITPTLLVTATPSPAMTTIEETTPTEQSDRLSALRNSLSKLEDGPTSETQMRVDDLMRWASIFHKTYSRADHPGSWPRKRPRFVKRSKSKSTRSSYCKSPTDGSKKSCSLQ